MLRPQIRDVGKPIRTKSENLDLIKLEPKMSIYDSTLGVLLIGTLIAGILFGIFTSQVYIYHKNFPEESHWIRFGLVDGMWLLELAHTICIFYSLYLYAVSSFGDQDILLLPVPHSWAFALFCHGWIAVLAQGYFTYRIARFGLVGPQRYPYIIPAFCAVLLFCQLLGDTALTVSVYITKESMQIYMNRHGWLILCPLIMRTVVDVTISGTLVYYLVYQRNNNAYRKTIAVLDKLILWSIETGIITSLVGIALIVSYLCDNSNYMGAFYMILPKVFSNTMLANMNSRIRLRELQSTTVMPSGFNIQFAHTTEIHSRASQDQEA